MIRLGCCEPEKPTEKAPEKDPSLAKAEIGGTKDEIAAFYLSSPEGLGVLPQNRNIHYWSNARFNLVQLMLYIIAQTGPAHIIMSSYSFSAESVSTLKHKQEKGELLSARFLIDNRVRSLSPKPFEQLTSSFPGCVRCTSIHAKVVCIWNDNWKISVVCSQNATSNPKLERGTIHTSFCEENAVFLFDKMNLEKAYQNGYE